MPAARPIYGAGGKWKQAEAAGQLPPVPYISCVRESLRHSCGARPAAEQPGHAARLRCRALYTGRATAAPTGHIPAGPADNCPRPPHRRSVRRHPWQHHRIPSVPCARRIHMLFPIYCPAVGPFCAAAALWTGPQERQDHVHRVQPGKRRLPAPVCRLQWQAEAQRPHGRNNNVQESAHTIPAREVEVAGCCCRFPRGRKAAVLCVPGDAGTASPSVQGWPQAAATDAPSANVCPTAARPPRLPPFHWRQPHCSISFSECQIILSL